MDIVLTACEGVLGHYLLDDWEESLDKLVEWLSVFLNFKLESLEDGLKGAQGGGLVALVV